MKKSDHPMLDIIAGLVCYYIFASLFRSLKHETPTLPKIEPQNQLAKAAPDLLDACKAASAAIDWLWNSEDFRRKFKNGEMSQDEKRLIGQARFKTALAISKAEWKPGNEKR